MSLVLCTLFGGILLGEIGSITAPVKTTFTKSKVSFAADFENVVVLVNKRCEKYTPK
jgi:hypothetical protein